MDTVGGRGHAVRACLLAAVATSAVAQAPPATVSDTNDPRPSVLTGIVTDTAGRRLPFALITVVGNPEWVLSEHDGFFRVTGIPPGWREISVRLIGYWPVVVEMNVPPAVTVHVQARLTPAAVTLETIVVEGKARYVALLQNGFYRREGVGAGHYLSPDDLQRYRPSSVTNLLRLVPGLRMRPVSGSVFDEVILGRHGSHDCAIRVFVDGLRMPRDVPLNSVVHPSQVLAVETYPSSTSVPVDFVEVDSRDPCGVIAIWTRWGISAIR